MTKFKIETQQETILNELTLGYKLTPLDALKICGCMRLSARIFDLKRHGWPIKSERVKVKTKYGEAVVTAYHLPAFFTT